MLPRGPFGTIVVDPPWTYTHSTRTSEVSGTGWRGAAQRHYPTMTMDELRALPVAASAAPDSCCWVWAVNSQLQKGFDLLAAWGFTYKNMLTWAKTTGRGLPATGMGYWLRGATEHLLLGVRGKPTPRVRNAPTWFTAPVGRHSAKPDAAYSVIERVSPGPFLDVFARAPRAGWVVWGNEVSP